MKVKNVSLKYVQSTHKPNTIASYPALPINQNGQKFYIVTIPVEDIFPFCFVIRRMEDPKQGFQRNLSLERAQDISQYLDNSKGSIPTNIVLSSQENSGISYNSNSKTLKYKRIENAFLVLDGQHRLFGYGLTKKKHRVPVAIYENLTRKEEASLFIDINTNQRGVPASLLIDIKQVADRETEREKQVRKLFDQLNSDPESALNGLLSPSSTAPGKISRGTFKRAIEDILNNNITNQLSDDARYKLIKNYFNALNETLSSVKLISKSAYFEAFCSIFYEAVRIAKTQTGNFKFDSLCEALAPIKNVDLEHIATAGNIRLSKANIVPILNAALSSHIQVDDNMA